MDGSFHGGNALDHAVHVGQQCSSKFLHESVRVVAIEDGLSYHAKTVAELAAFQLLLEGHLPGGVVVASFENDWTTHTITLREHDLGPEDVTQDLACRLAAMPHHRTLLLIHSCTVQGGGMVALLPQLLAANPGLIILMCAETFEDDDARSPAAALCLSDQMFICRPCAQEEEVVCDRGGSHLGSHLQAAATPDVKEAMHRLLCEALVLAESASALTSPFAVALGLCQLCRGVFDGDVVKAFAGAVLELVEQAAEAPTPMGAGQWEQLAGAVHSFVVGNDASDSSLCIQLVDVVIQHALAVLPATHPKLVRCMQLKADFLIRQAKGSSAIDASSTGQTGAEQALAQALPLCQHLAHTSLAAEPNRETTLHRLSDLGTCYILGKDYASALPWLRRAAAGWRRLLGVQAPTGDAHMWLAHALRDQSKCHLALEQFEQAELCARKHLAWVSRRCRGEDEAMGSMVTIATCLVRRQCWDEALALVHYVLAWCREPGHGCARTLTALRAKQVLALTNLESGDVQEGLELLLQALNTSAECLGRTHDLTLELATRLTGLIRQQSSPSTFHLSHAQRESITERVLGALPSGHSLAMDCLSSLADWEQHSGLRKPQIATLVRLLELQQQHLPQGAWFKQAAAVCRRHVTEFDKTVYANADNVVEGLKGLGEFQAAAELAVHMCEVGGGEVRGTSWSDPYHEKPGTGLGYDGQSFKVLLRRSFAKLDREAAATVIESSSAHPELRQWLHSLACRGEAASLASSVYEQEAMTGAPHIGLDVAPPDHTVMHERLREGENQSESTAAEFGDVRLLQQQQPQQQQRQQQQQQPGITTSVHPSVLPTSARPTERPGMAPVNPQFTSDSNRVAEMMQPQLDLEATLGASFSPPAPTPAQVAAAEAAAATLLREEEEEQAGIEEWERQKKARKKKKQKAKRSAAAAGKASETDTPADTPSSCQETNTPGDKPDLNIEQPLGLVAAGCGEGHQHLRATPAVGGELSVWGMAGGCNQQGQAEGCSEVRAQAPVPQVPTFADHSLLPPHLQLIYAATGRTLSCDGGRGAGMYKGAATAALGSIQPSPCTAATPALPTHNGDRNARLDAECCVCLEVVKGGRLFVAFMPCGHRKCCDECAAMVWAHKKECPYCAQGASGYEV